MMQYDANIRIIRYARQNIGGIQTKVAIVTARCPCQRPHSSIILESSEFLGSILFVQDDASNNVGNREKIKNILVWQAVDAVRAIKGAHLSNKFGQRYFPIVNKVFSPL